ncbi:flavin reductase family protein [Streptomyces sp. 11x1]|uniref:flavin reductase family protein n=1 Tax=Streptomyces sp. 11x1 TaxID=3038642 RepID=UPI00293138F2|nr:flavin reductase family protein [Streptomyces sp. 11x1]WNZ12908.1 flavin reductase family protein [Streptomyces sp. 11x1]
MTEPHNDIEIAGPFREAMASFPSGVTIVTTVDEDGRPWGFTASAFSSVSAEPPLVQVSLSRSAECHPVFERSSRWAINILHDGHHALARRFATRGADKFAGNEFRLTPEGLPYLPDASVRLDVSAYDRHVSGDHTILVARVHDVQLGQEPATVYFQRGFHALAS